MPLQDHSMPAEWQAHTRTIMAWPGAMSDSYWPPGNCEQMVSDVTRVAQAISRFEPVTLYVALSQAREAQSKLQHLGGAVEVKYVDIDDLKPWMRDIAPTFIQSHNGNDNAAGPLICGLDFHFNGWGKKDQTQSNRSFAARILHDLAIPSCPVSIVAEGGALETDGEGTLLATESSLINPNRNPGMDKNAIERELKRVLGVSTIIWLPGVRDVDTTDCHIDALARFARSGVVVLSCPAPTRDEVWTRVYNESRRLLTNTRDAKGRMLRVVDIPEPDISTLKGANPEMIPSYVNFYHAAGAVIIPQFGSPDTDGAAVAILGDLFPDIATVPVYLHGLPNAGGGLHCITQQVPALD